MCFEQVQSAGGFGTVFGGTLDLEFGAMPVSPSSTEDQERHRDRDDDHGFAAVTKLTGAEPIVSAVSTAFTERSLRPGRVRG